MKKKDLSKFSYVWKIIKKNLPLLVVVAILSITISFINIYLISIEKRLTDVVVDRNLSLFKQILFISFAIILIKIPLEYIKSYLHGKFTERSLVDLRNEVAKKLTFANIKHIEKNSTGDFISRLTSDISIVQMFLSSSLGDILYHPIVFTIGLMYGIMLSWQMTLFSFTVIPVVIIAALFLSKPVERFTKKQQELIGKGNEVTQDALSEIVITKSYLLEGHLFQRFKMYLEKAFDVGLKTARISALLESAKIILHVAPQILLVLFGGYMVIMDRLTFGGLIAFLELMNIFLSPLNVLPNIINGYRKAVAALERINEIFLYPDEKLGEKKEIRESCENVIEFENVTFSYDSERPILEDINLRIKKGEKVAIVGSSGSGKSTIVKLILGLYTPQKGEIKVFGVPIREWDIKALRERLSVVNQDVFLFPENIYENVRYGRLEAEREEIEEACRKAYIHDFIINEAGGYDKKIGERGVNLSGGQRQRIAIARAILKKADVFIFDEATSSLDTESENLIQSAINEIVKEKTAIIIAHRFSTIKNVDRIIVLNDGKVCEEGSHEELMKKKGIYYELYFRQFGGNVYEEIFY